MLPKGILLFADGQYKSGCTCCTRQLPGLEHVANRPIVHHVLDAMRAAGVEELIVAGSADVLIDLRPCLNSYDEGSMRLDYAICDERRGDALSLRSLAPLVGAAPCIVHPGDGLLNEPLAPYVEALGKRSADLILLCPGATFRAAPPRPLEEEEEEEPPLTVPGLLRDAGIGVFGPGAFRQACQLDGEHEASGLGELAQQLSDDGGHVHVYLADGWRRYRGNPNDLLEVNRLALDLLAPQLRPASGSHNQIEGRVQIDRTATVTRSVLVGPVVVGAGAEIANSYVGPYTSIGAGATLEGVEIERSIIAPGARATHVGTRLVSSILGRGAHVFRDFSLPRAMRLQVAAGDEVALC